MCKLNITLSRLEDINRAMVLNFGGCGIGFKDNNLTISAIEGCNQFIFGVELYDGIIDKINHLAFSIVANHIFLDANKRTATLITSELLKKNGYSVELVDVREYIISIAKSEVNEKESLEVLTHICNKDMQIF